MASTCKICGSINDVVSEPMEFKLADKAFKLHLCGYCAVLLCSDLLAQFPEDLRRETLKEAVFTIMTCDCETE
jgi:hypothetical protein